MPSLPNIYKSQDQTLNTTMRIIEKSKMLKDKCK